MERALDTEGFEVLSAYDGLAALDIAETNKPNAIVLDIMMPMMSGYETCAQLKKNPNTQILCLTPLKWATKPAKQSLKACSINPFVRANSLYNYNVTSAHSSFYSRKASLKSMMEVFPLVGKIIETISNR